MANGGLNLNRDVIRQYAEYAEVLATYLDEKVEAVRKACAYLKNEENISGGDSEEMRRGVDIIEKAMNDATAKAAALKKGAQSINEKMGNAGNIATKTLADIKDEVAKTKAKIGNASTK